jgi:hypothetical protein
MVACNLVSDAFSSRILRHEGTKASQGRQKEDVLERFPWAEYSRSTSGLTPNSSGVDPSALWCLGALGKYSSFEFITQIRLTRNRGTDSLTLKAPDRDSRAKSLSCRAVATG